MNPFKSSVLINVAEDATNHVHDSLLRLPNNNIDKCVSKPDQLEIHKLNCNVKGF